MIISTEACGFSFTILSTAFSDCLRTKPKVSKADNASFLFVLLVPAEIDDKPYTFKILSFKSKTTLWAVLAPIPFIDCIVAISFVAMASKTCSGAKDDSMVLAVLAPTPETLINNLNISRSATLENPYNVWASSRTSKWVNSLTFSLGGSSENVCKEILIKYPTPLQSITTSVGVFSTSLPCIWVIMC